jgi:predicted choloylglycine hydrolase
MIFTALGEDMPGQRWHSRWRYSWPAYQAWLAMRGFKTPSSECREALRHHMPELVPTYEKLLQLAGDGDLEARFLSHWQPPAYLSGCSIAAKSSHGMVRLVRNYDLTPELNEGLLLKTRWHKQPVMGMVEFLWGLSDGINEAGLCAAIAYGGRNDTGAGFGITLIVRYILEICSTVEEALTVLKRVPSHMAYNVTLADRPGNTASVELQPGGGLRHVWPAVATNHQNGPDKVVRHRFTETHDRRAYLQSLLADDPSPDSMVEAFLAPPLFQKRYKEGFGTLFTAEYDPGNASLTMHWQTDKWIQRFDPFRERHAKVIRYPEAS